MTEETVRYRAACPIAGCAGLAWWFGRVADSGGGTTYRCWDAPCAVGRKIDRTSEITRRRVALITARSSRGGEPHDNRVRVERLAMPRRAHRRPVPPRALRKLRLLRTRKDASDRMPDGRRAVRVAVHQRLVRLRGSIMTDELTDYGFTFGAIEVTRLASTPDGSVCLRLSTATQKIEVYASPAGRSLRVFTPGGDEWKPASRVGA